MNIAIAIMKDPGIIPLIREIAVAVAIAVDRRVARQTREVHVDTIVDGSWAGITIGQQTTLGCTPLWGELSVDTIRKATMVTEHDNARFVSFYLEALRMIARDLR